ncbi:lasso peptide biosynthesis B2 protein [Caulobacter sp. S45]|jgi:hypothetical protein|uniref:lasso peptide biosynthesis B2 protein n=1 Tax=Caulobacter sp. S45 TaxID=1641861 RepID=UPI00210FF7AB|nr:lasso peptide biosynthesis B2 protein [Caulobacter sp. S45]
MHPPRKLRIPSVGDAVFLTGCLLTVAAFRMALFLAPYRHIRKLMPARASAAPPAWKMRRVHWGVSAAARLVPRATCLTQALAGQYLLACRGYRTEMRIGAARGASGEFSAHAWLISGDVVILGGTPSDLARFSQLADLAPRST